MTYFYYGVYKKIVKGRQLKKLWICTLFRKIFAVYSFSVGLLMYYMCQVGEGWRKVKLNSQEQGSELIHQKENEG